MRCLLLVLLLFAGLNNKLSAQSSPKQSIAVLNIDGRGIGQDTMSITTLVRLELEKTGVYTVMDRYEVADIVNKTQIDINKCFSKTCLVETGKLLKVDKMLGGSVELVGEKVVVTLRLIDVASGTIEKSDATEYLNLPELQKMVKISIQKLLGIQTDKVMVGQLIDYDVPIQSPKNTLRLNGPRMGFNMTLGSAMKVLTDPASKGGFDMSPVSFIFGWQQEFQYISAGNFQALVENIFMIGGLESGRFIPYYAPILGFRFGKGAWEFGFGPTFRFIKTAEGYYDAYGDWHLKSEMPYNANYTLVKRLDSRGDVELSTGLIIALGKTFHSGYLNIPLNVYIAPRKEGTTVGATFGFNIQKKDREISRHKKNKE